MRKGWLGEADFGFCSHFEWLDLGLLRFGVIVCVICRGSILWRCGVRWLGMLAVLVFGWGGWLLVGFVGLVLVFIFYEKPSH